PRVSIILVDRAPTCVDTLSLHDALPIYLSAGAMGFAEATPRTSIYGETPESVAAIIAGECSDALIGQPVESLADLHRADEKLALDRKSTRLNSSHVKTSYAVFCLKTKKH